MWCHRNVEVEVKSMSDYQKLCDEAEPIFGRKNFRVLVGNSEMKRWKWDDMRTNEDQFISRIWGSHCQISHEWDTEILLQTENILAAHKKLVWLLTLGLWRDRAADTKEIQDSLRPWHFPGEYGLSLPGARWSRCPSLVEADRKQTCRSSTKRIVERHLKPKRFFRVKVEVVVFLIFPFLFFFLRFAICFILVQECAFRYWDIRKLSQDIECCSVSRQTCLPKAFIWMALELPCL